MNKWVTIQLEDGTNLQVNVTSADFNYATEFLTRQSYSSLVCNGTAIQNSQQAEACKGQWVQLVLPNHISLSFYLTRLGVVGHVVLGIVGAVVGGFLAGVIFGTDPIQGQLDAASVVTAVIGAVLVVMVVSTLMGRSRTGRGAV